jgi:YidC/Oxa1 family membrane protein insertase
MWDEDQDREMMRRQMSAIFLIGFILLGWMMFFSPQKPVVESEPIPEVTDPLQNTARAEEPAPTTAVTPTSEEVQALPWPALPPVPTNLDPQSDGIIIGNEKIEMVFTRIGGRLKSATMLLGEEGTIQLVPEAPDTPDTETVYPLGLRFRHSSLRDELDFRRFDAKVNEYGDAVVFTLELPGNASVQKTFTLLEDSYLLNIDVEYKNLEAASRSLGLDLEPSYTLNWGPGMIAREEGTYFKPSMLWLTEDEIEHKYVNKLPDANETPEEERVRNIEWMGYRSKYFLAALRNDNGDVNVGDAWYQGNQGAFRFGLHVPQFSVSPNESNRQSFQLFLGPMQKSTLGEAWPGLDRSLTFFDYPRVLDWFAKVLLQNLNWWNSFSFIPNYGVAIIMLTLIVRIVMLPLTLKSMRSMRAMQALQPEMKELQELHKDNQQELSKAMMELYRERGANPFGGCMPMLLQMPVFIALYRMIWYSFEIRGADFLWIGDLSIPDRLFHFKFLSDVPLLSFFEYLNILPILMIGAMVLSFKLSPTSAVQNQQQKIMMTIMPVFFGVISYQFSAGLNLYVLTSTVLGIVQQQFARMGDPPKPPVKKKKKSMEEIKKDRKKHFYDRAQERKRQQAKAGKKGKHKK